MARFLIRNYGPSRQIPYKGQNLCFYRDQAIETDNEEMVAVLGKDKLMHVTDRGVEFAAPVIPEKRKKKERKVTVDDAEAVHDENFPDEDERQQPTQQTQENQQPVSSDDINEIDYADMTVRELMVLAKDRQLKYSGVKKADLIQSLLDYDAEG